VLSRPETPLPPAAEACIDGWAERRADGEPVAYILGEQAFWDLDFAVSPAVLIPRPETELLVEQALAAAAAFLPPASILDLGTGSGAVAVTLAVEFQRRGVEAHITATDVSPEALAVARVNAERHGAAIELRQGDWFRAVRGRFHVIVANPPYVAAGDPHLEALRHEPLGALTAGTDGFDAIRTLIGSAPTHLYPGGRLLLEHGFDQGSRVRALLRRAGFRAVATLPDLAGIERVSTGRHDGASP
jgi:release factor glutamine methyltransferase